MTVHDIPPIEASLNGLATLLITAGFIFIKRGDRAAHRACMLSAAVASALFLGFYLAYHASAKLQPLVGERNCKGNCPRRSKS